MALGLQFVSFGHGQGGNHLNRESESTQGMYTCNYLQTHRLTLYNTILLCDASY